MIFKIKRKNRLTRSEKKMLWSQIMEAVRPDEQTAKISVSKWSGILLPKFHFKVVLVSFLILVLLTGSTAATVYAADDAVPGDFLFPLDIAVEKIQIVFLRGNKKDTIRIKFAEERLKEVKIVLALAGNTRREIRVRRTTPPGRWRRSPLRAPMTGRGWRRAATHAGNRRSAWRPRPAPGPGFRARR